MKKIWKYILITLFLVISIILIIWLNKRAERKIRHFKKIEFVHTNEILNRTDINYIDTVVYVGLKELGVRYVTVIVYPLNKNIKNNFPPEFELKAHIRGVGSNYIIWIDDMSKLETIQVLSHELIHLQQYYTKKLIYSDSVTIWNNQVMDINTLDYNSRPWEIEAFQQESSLEKKMLKDLFE